MKSSPSDDRFNKAMTEKADCLHRHYRGEKNLPGRVLGADWDESEGFIASSNVVSSEARRAVVLP